MSSFANTDNVLARIATEVARTINEGLTAVGAHCVIAHAGSVDPPDKLVRTFHVREVREQQALELEPQIFAATWGAKLTAELLRTLKQAHHDGIGMVFSDLPKPIPGSFHGTVVRGSYDKVKVLAAVEYQLPEYLYTLGVQFSTFNMQLANT